MVTRRVSLEQRVQHITQGEFAVGSSPEDMITTLLGSCVSVCLWDPEAGVGGMNHILLPDGAGYTRDNLRINAMELLINSLIKQGAEKSRLKAKLFGGARMVVGLSDIGEKNAVFARRFLSVEEIECVGESLGGTSARTIQYWPYHGRVRQKRTESDYLREPVLLTPESPKSDVELF